MRRDLKTLRDCLIQTDSLPLFLGVGVLLGFLEDAMTEWIAWFWSGGVVAAVIGLVFMLVCFGIVGIAGGIRVIRDRWRHR